MSQFALTVIVDQDDIGPSVASLANRFGEVQVQALGYNQGLNDEIDENDDVPTEDDEVMVLRILQGAHQRMASQPGQDAAIQAQQLDELIHALQAPPAQRREELINPLKLPQPTGEPPTTSRKFSVQPTDDSPAAQAIKRTIIREIACPKCGSPSGRACQSLKGADYGVGHVHAARIEAWQSQ